VHYYIPVHSFTIYIVFQPIIPDSEGQVLFVLGVSCSQIHVYESPVCARCLSFDTAVLVTQQRWSLLELSLQLQLSS